MTFLLHKLKVFLLRGILPAALLGFVFQSKAGQGTLITSGSYFWIGGNQGSWNDGKNWSLTRHGEPAYAWPQGDDDAMFDTNGELTIVVQHPVSVGTLTVTKQCNLNLLSPAPSYLEIHHSFYCSGKLSASGIVLHFSSSQTMSFFAMTQIRADVIVQRGKLNLESDLAVELFRLEKWAQLHLQSHSLWATRIESGEKPEVKGTASVIAYRDFISEEFALVGKNLGNYILPVHKQVNPCGTIPFTLTATATTNYNGWNTSCNDSTDATICVNVAGGVGPFTYQWVTGPATSCWTGVGAGNYLVVVFDQGQGGTPCNTSIIVNEPTALTLFSWTGTDPSCNGVCDGTANPVIIGGQSPYSYVWSTGETTSIATQLCVGLNTLQVTDANGCPFDTTFFILTPTPVVPNAVAVDAGCFGVCDGMAYAVPSGGNGAPYTFSWLPGGSTNDTIYNLCAGNYTVTVLDNNNCPGQQTVTVNEPIPISITLTNQTNLVCNGICSGSLTINATNGTSPYNYQWYDAGTGLPLAGQTNATASGLCAGTYYLIVSDANGCSIQSVNYTITQPTPVTGTAISTNCICNGVCTGTLSISPSGGVPGYTITWIDASTSNTVGTGSPLLNVCPGTYFAEIQDGNGCIINSNLVTVTEPPALTLTVSHTDILCAGQCTGTATAVSGGGSPGLTVTWHLSPSGTQVGAAGNTINNLCAGTYFCTVTDANGCQLSSAPFTVTEPLPLVISNESATDVSCNGSCDGVVNFTLSGGTPAITVQWYSVPGNIPAGTGLPLSGLCPGTYFAIVTDANNCTISSNPLTINEPSALTVTVDTTGTACGTACSGIATANPLGGSPGYNFVWYNATTGLPIGQTGISATGLCAGSYYVEVTDANGCTVQSNIVIILPNTIVTGTIIGTNIVCNGFCNGLANLSPAGGVPPYTYIWYDQNTGLPIGQSTEDANGLCAGDYYVIITDANLCSSLPVAITITQPPALSISLSSANIQCAGQCTGSITATVIGGSPPYTLSWINSVTGFPIGQSGLVASNLCAGSYELLVTDANGCSQNSIPVIISEPTPLTGSLVTTDIACNGQCNGMATYSVGGGILPYVFTWSSSGNTTSVESGLCAGNYTVTVTDDNGCNLGPTAFSITEPTPFSASVVDGNISCLGLCDGVVSVNALGGTGPYTYQWNDPMLQTTAVASGLCVGSYDVTITDANGCNYGPFTATVANSTSPTGTATSADALCNGICNGNATANPAGGAPPYSYVWDDPLAQTTQTAIGLCAGNYTVIVTDANGCSSAPVPVTVNEPAALITGFVVTPVSCNAQCNGSIITSASGGIPGYNYQWSNGSTASSVNGLCAGNYSLTLTDANGCQLTENYAVTEPGTITATMTTTSTACGACTATATITPSGGTPGYSYQWSASAGNQITQTATALCAGIHSVTVTDNAGCAAVFSAAVSNPNGELVGTDSTLATCNNLCDGTATVIFVCSDPPCSVLWNDPLAQTTATATGLCPGLYTAAVTNNAGCITSVQVNVGSPLPLDANATAANALCNSSCNGTGTALPTGGTSPYSFAWNDPLLQTTSTAFNFCPGMYMVTVTDSSGCQDTDTVFVFEPSAITFSVTASDVNCNGQCNGSGNAFVSGGTPPYSYLWDDPSSQTTQSATALCAGTYNVTVFDSSGCTSGPQSITINEPAAPVLTVTSVSPQCSGICNGTASISVLGGTPPYFYNWDDPFNQTTSTATNLCAGTYSVTVTDAAGCTLGVETVILNDPAAISINLSSQDPLCNGQCNGIITAGISGGISPYSLVWNVGGQTGSTATGLCAGNYILTVTDANGCMNTGSSSLADPSVLQANLSVSDASCSGQCDGAASVNPVGGTAPLSVVWSPGNETSNSISSLCSGNYSVSISDANGCNQDFPFSINEPTQLVLVTGSSPSTCGVCNGSASVGPSGGTPPYLYQWDVNASSQITQVAQNLCSGLYDVTVTDGLGCQMTTTVSVTDINAESLSVNTTNATCADVCNGTATTLSTCNNGPCNFQWYNAVGTNLGSSASSLNGLCPGNYFTELTNGMGCVSIVPFTINSPDTLVVSGVIAPPPCNGQCNTSITLSVNGGTPGYSYQWDAAAGNSTNPIVNNLCAGSYTVVVTDVLGCDDTVTFAFIDPPALQLNLSAAGVSCNGNCNGVATAVVTGGTPGYTYTWNDPGNQTTPVATGLCGGTYALVVTDAAGCSVVNGNISIPEPALLTVSVSSTPNVCNNDCNGQTSAVVNGGTLPYAIQWDDPALQTTATATGLCSGNYNVTVTDANNCSNGPQSINVPEPASVTFTALATSVNCNGICSGLITVTAAGGTGSYLYSLDNGVTFQAANSFTNLCAGSYTVLVIDNSGCFSAPQNVNVNTPAPLTATYSTFEPPCGLNSGAITVFPSGGTPAYSYVWYDAAMIAIGQTTQTAINLVAGIYTVTVTDAAGCTLDVTVNLSNSNAPTSSSVFTVPVCNGDCSATIDVTVSGGTLPYSYLWIPDGQTTEDLQNVCAGTYLLQITDANLCLRFEQVTITQPATFTASFASVNATCGQCNGSATVTASGGTAPLQYIWSNGAGGNTANNLCAGAYTVQVSDASGCSTQFNTTIDNTSAPALAVAVTQVTCGSVCDGSATANAFGGTPPYSFLWLHNGSTAAAQNNLCTGTYLVQVQDANGCINTQSATIASPQTLVDSVVMQPAGCGVCDGVLSAFVTSGFPPYSYQWSPSAGSGIASQATALCAGVHYVIITDGLGCADTVYTVMNNTTIPDVTLNVSGIDCYGNCNATATAAVNGSAPFNIIWQDNTGISIGQSGNNAINLCADDYMVQVTDANNCIVQLSFSITEPDSIQLSMTFLQDETCFNTCDGILAAMPVNGTLPMVYAWNDPLMQTTSIATGLCDGVYTVTMTDANGCQAQLTDTVSDPPAIVIQFDTTGTTCSSVSDGAIDATVTGGAGGFVFSWTGPNGFTSGSEDLINIYYGNYILTVTDANGCSFTDSIYVDAWLIAQANAGPDTSFCASVSQLTLTGSSITPGVSYTWYDSLGNILSAINTVTVSPPLGTSYYILVVDINGCTGNDTVWVTSMALPQADAGFDIDMIKGDQAQIGGNPTTTGGNPVVWTPSADLSDTSALNPFASPDSTTQYIVAVTGNNGCVNYDTMMVNVLPDIIFPNGFSPNGDGKNDVWIIDFIQEFPDNEVQVFNRWGQPVFYSQGYADPWDGTYNGKPVTVGTYYYIIKLNHPLYPNDFTGPLTILR